MKQYWPHIPLLVLVVLLAVVGLHLASGAKSQPSDVSPAGVMQAPPELQGLAQELAKPEYRDLPREEALQLLRSRGFVPDAKPEKEQVP